MHFDRGERPPDPRPGGRAPGDQRARRRLRRRQGGLAGAEGRRPGLGRLDADAGESGLAEAGAPRRGPASSSTAWRPTPTAASACPRRQLAISGMMVVRAIYDTLTVPNARAATSPYLAKSSPTTTTTPSGPSRSATASSSTTAPTSPARSSRTTSTPTAARTRPGSPLLFTLRAREHRDLDVVDGSDGHGHDQGAVGGLPGLPLQLAAGSGSWPRPSSTTTDPAPQARSAPARSSS